jgi:hypothetical protein
MSHGECLCCVTLDEFRAEVERLKKRLDEAEDFFGFLPNRQEECGAKMPWIEGGIMYPICDLPVGHEGPHQTHLTITHVAHEWEEK